MYCIHCGHKLEEGGKFCSACGNVVGQASDAILSQTTSKRLGVLKVALVCFAVLLIVGVSYTSFLYFRQEKEDVVTGNATSTKQAMINTVVSAVNAKVTFPAELDEATTWTGISGTSDTIRFQYMLHNVDESQLNSTVLHDMLTSTVCEDSDTKALIDADIHLEYSYAVKDSGQTYFVTMSKDDCVQTSKEADE